MVEGVLIAAEEKTAKQLGDLLRERYGRLELLCASSGSHTRRILLHQEADLVIIAAPLTDETGLELAVHAAAETTCGVILLVPASQAEEVAARCEDDGVFVVERPINRTFLFRAIGLVNAASRRLRQKESEQRSLRRKMEEIRLVDRAKLTLVQYLGMTESAAHRHIEKQAMDLRLTKKEVAESILRTYES